MCATQESPVTRHYHLKIKKTYIEFDISAAVPLAEGTIDTQNGFMVLVLDGKLGETEAPGLVDVANHGAWWRAHCQGLQTTRIREKQIGEMIVYEV